MEKVSLTPKDKKYLLGIGYLEEDILQISRTEFRIESRGKQITAQKAIHLVGRNSFLATIGRATFHWNSIATNSNYSKRVCIKRAY